MQNLINLPASAFKKAGGAVTSVASNVAASIPRLVKATRRGSSDTDVLIDEDYILRHSHEKLNLTLKSTPSKDCATTSALAVKSGFLMKRNEQGQWRRVVASIVPHWFLYYFDSDLAESPKGVIDLQLYMKMAIESGNVMRIGTDTKTDGSQGPLRAYYFSDDDPNVLREWIDCMQRERYQVVRDERDAYQQLQDQFSGEMAHATLEMQESAQDRERLQLEAAHCRLAADDSLAAMQRVLVFVGVTEEEMRKLGSSPPRAADAIVSYLQGLREDRNQAVFESEQKRASERARSDERLALLERQLEEERGMRLSLEKKHAEEVRDYERTVMEEMRAARGQLDKASLNLQMSVAAKAAAEEKAAVLVEQKKVLVKEVRALRDRKSVVWERVS
jgi:hypothetical protein